MRKRLKRKQFKKAIQYHVDYNEDVNKRFSGYTQPNIVVPEMTAEVLLKCTEALKDFGRASNTLIVRSEIFPDKAFLINEALLYEYTTPKMEIDIQPITETKEEREIREIEERNKERILKSLSVLRSFTIPEVK